MFMGWCKEVRHHIQIFMTHTFRLIYFRFPWALTHMWCSTHIHIQHTFLYTSSHIIPWLSYVTASISCLFILMYKGWYLGCVPSPPSHLITAYLSSPADYLSLFLHLSQWGTGGEVPEGGRALTHVCQLPQWLTDIFGLEWEGKGGVGCAMGMASCPQRAGERKQTLNSPTKVGIGSGQKGQQGLCQRTSQPRIATVLARTGLFSQPDWTSMKQHYWLI